MSLFDLRVVNPDDPDNYLEYLDGWSNLTASTDRKAPGVCTFTYPRRGAHRNLLATNQIVAFLQDGYEAENCRYLVRGIERGISDGVPVEEWSLLTVWDGLRQAPVERAGGGSIGSLTLRVFTAISAGAIFAQLLNDALPFLTFWGYQGMTFTPGEDSDGQPWAVIDELEFPIGSTSVFDVVNWLVDNNYIEVSTQGGWINAYVPDSRGTDLTAAEPPVVIHQGRDIKDAPEQISYDDWISDLLVRGGETADPADESKNRPVVYVRVTGPQTYGRRSGTLTVEGVQSATELRRIGAAYMKRYADGPRRSRTYSVDIPEHLFTPAPVAYPEPRKRPSLKFTPWRTLTPLVRTIKPQSFGIGGTRFLYLAQSVEQVTTADFLTVTRYSQGASPKESGQMHVTGGGFGRSLFVDHVDTPGVLGGNDFVVFQLGETSADNSQAPWVRLPWTPGKVWTTAEARSLTTAAPIGTDPLPRAPWFQGAARWGGYEFRLHGTPYTNSGSTVTPAIPAYVQVLKGSVEVDWIDASMLGRKGQSRKGLPYGGRMQPDGLNVVEISGWPHLVLGFSINRTPSYQLRLYTYPIPYPAPASDPLPVSPELFLPMVAYGAADTIGVSLGDGILTRRDRVEVISATCDSRNTGSYLVTVGDWLDDRDAKLDRLLARGR